MKRMKDNMKQVVEVYGGDKAAIRRDLRRGFSIAELAAETRPESDTAKKWREGVESRFATMEFDGVLYRSVEDRNAAVARIAGEQCDRRCSLGYCRHAAAKTDRKRTPELTKWPV